MKAATVGAIVIVHARRFQSTPPVKAATCAVYSTDELTPEISIHAAREGGDFLQISQIDGVVAISIHAAREGGDALSERA